MKWFKHESDDRNKIESKLVRSKFGAEGYGIYTALQEVVAEYVEEQTIGKWGHVHPLHDINSLAQECAVTPERLKEFLAYCDEKKIFERDEMGLFYPLILKRLDTFAERIKREYKPSTKSVRSQYAIDEIRRDKKRRDKTVEFDYSESKHKLNAKAAMQKSPELGKKYRELVKSKEAK